MNQFISRLQDYLSRLKFPYVMLFFGLAIALSVSRVWLFILLIAVIDFIGSYIESIVRFNILLTDIILFGVILLSYSLNPMYGIILYSLFFLNRLILGKFEPRYIIKIPYVFIVSYLAFFLRDIDIVVLGPALFLARYMMEYIVSFALGNPNLERLPQRMMHLLFSIAYFSIFAWVIVSLIR